MYYDIKFKGLQTHDPERAVQMYRERVGCEPTVIIIHPSYPVRSEHPLLVRSAAGTVVYMLLTHEISMNDVLSTEAEWSEKHRPGIQHHFDVIAQRNIDYQRAVQSAAEAEKNSFKRGGSPQKPTCPHCRHELVKEDFENLGWWWGWSEGIIPPYWDELRLYVFRRDDFRCWRCAEIYPVEKLNAHHVTPKEDKGTDSAKNLRTTCIYCHEDLKPIMPPEVQNYTQNPM